ncbi:hypothetical protein OSJ57_04745 [Sphingomonas sp. HH69]
MELGDFIAATLSEIMRGVSLAAKAHDGPSVGGSIAPMPVSKMGNPDGLLLREVEFDVAITTESSTERSKSGGMNIKVIEADLTAGSSEKTLGESRVKFSVPIQLPFTRLDDV